MAILKEFAINTRLIPVKATYFFTLAASASLVPYLPVYMKQIGLSQTEAGIIFGTKFVGVLWKPLFGAIADKYKQHKLMLMLCLIFSGMFYSCLAILSYGPIAPVPYKVYQVSVIDSSNSYLELCLKHVDSNLPFSANISDNNPLKNMGTCNFFKSHFQCPMTLNNGTNQTVCPSIQTLCINSTANSQCLEKNLIMRASIRSDEMKNACFKYVTDLVDYDNKTHDDDWVIYCDRRILFNCKMTCDTMLGNLTTMKDCTCPGIKEKYSEYGKIFWIFFILFLLAQFFFDPVPSLLDGILYSFLGEDHQYYGKTRLFGTIGYMLFGLISGLVMDLTGDKDGNKNYTVAFVLFPSLHFLATMMVCLYKVSDDVQCGKLFNNILVLLKDFEVLVLLGIVFVFGINHGLIVSFLFWHLHDIGGSQLLFGLCMATNSCIEIFLFFFSKMILQRIGHINCFYMVFVAHFLRLLFYSFLKNPWLALLVEPLHSVTFGLLYAAASSYGSVITPPGMHGTIQGLISAMYFAMGRGIGSLTGGKIYKTFGAHIMFLGFAIATAVIGVVYAILQVTVLWNRSLSRKHSPDHETMDDSMSGHACHDTNGSTLLNGSTQSIEDSTTFGKEKDLLIQRDDTGNIAKEQKSYLE